MTRAVLGYFAALAIGTTVGWWTARRRGERVLAELSAPTVGRVLEFARVAGDRMGGQP